MSRRRPRKCKTDYGTIILHWLMVGSLAVAVITGLRIAGEAPDRTWINSIDGLLPTSMVWTGHIRAAVALTAVAVAYTTYLPLAGLVRRIRLDGVRLCGLFGRKQQRWGAINVILYWGFYMTLLVQLMTGGLLYVSYAPAFLLAVHWYGMWIILGYASLHVMSNWVLGGPQQLLRIVRPALLPPRTPRFDPMEVFALLDKAAKSPKPAEALRPAQSPAQPRVHRPLKWSDAPPPLRDQAPRRQPARSAEATARDHTPPRAKAPHYADGPPAQAFPDLQPRRPQRRRGPALQANPFMVAIAVPFVGVTVLVTIDRQMVDTIKVRRIARSEVPVLDGDASDAVWQMVRPFYLLTEQGGNFFDGRGGTMAEIRALNDGERAYFPFVWDDPTRSLKQLPLQKAADGWHLLHAGYEIGDEHAYNEDKFSVLLTKLDQVLAGDRTFHAGRKPIAGKPATLSGRELHYTTQDNLYVDVWEWKATSGGALSYMDDLHFGPPLPPTQAQFEGKAPYRGGFEPDPGTVNFSDNFDQQRVGGYRYPIIPHRLPKDYNAMIAAMGQIDLNPNHGESDGARWSMTTVNPSPFRRKPALKSLSARLSRASSSRASMREIAPTFVARRGGRLESGRSRRRDCLSPRANTTLQSAQGLS